MRRWAWVLVLLMILSAQTMATTRLAILDFRITGSPGRVQELGYLSELLPEIMGSNLSSQGLVVLPREAVQRGLSVEGLPSWGLDEAQARLLAKTMGVDRLIQGNLSSLGNTLILEVKVLSGDTGSVLGVATARGSSEDDLISMLDTIQASLRAHLGGMAPPPQTSVPSRQPHPPLFQPELYYEGVLGPGCDLAEDDTYFIEYTLDVFGDELLRIQLTSWEFTPYLWVLLLNDDYSLKELFHSGPTAPGEIYLEVQPPICGPAAVVVNTMDAGEEGAFQLRLLGAESPIPEEAVNQQSSPAKVEATASDSPGEIPPSPVSGSHLDAHWTQDQVLRQRGKWDFAGIYEYNNLRIDDHVGVYSYGISHLVIKVNGVLWLGKDAFIQVRNGFYPEAPHRAAWTIDPSDIPVLGIDAGGFYVLPRVYGRGGNGGDGEWGGPGYGEYVPLGFSQYYLSGGRGGNGGGGGGGGFGGGKGGDGGLGAVGNRSLGSDGGKGQGNGGDGGTSTGSLGGTGGGALGLGMRGTVYMDDESLYVSAGSGGGGNGGSGGPGSPGLQGNGRNGAGGGGGGYGGGVLTIIANEIRYDPAHPPKLLVSGQRGGWSSGFRGQDGEGGLLIIQVVKPETLPASLWNLGDGYHWSEKAQDYGHGEVVGDPGMVIMNGKWLR